MAAILHQLRPSSTKPGHQLFGLFRRRPTNASAHSESIEMCWTKVGGIAIRRVCWLWGFPRSDLCVESGSELQFFGLENSGAPGFRVSHNATITHKASAKKARKGHSTDVIENTSIVEITIDIKKAEVSSNCSSYQTLTTDVNLRRNYACKKLNK
jgi:hypothetical protein